MRLGQKGTPAIQRGRDFPIRVDKFSQFDVVPLEYVMQFVVLAGGGIDDFVAIVEVWRVRDEIEFHYVNADGFIQFAEHHAFAGLFCH